MMMKSQIRLTPVTLSTTVVYDTQPTAGDHARIAAAAEKRRRRAAKRMGEQS
ncbi:MAG: hypothetical protein Devi2KO_36210 [Devosia indica]